MAPIVSQGLDCSCLCFSYMSGKHVCESGLQPCRDPTQTHGPHRYPTTPQCAGGPGHVHEAPRSGHTGWQTLVLSPYGVPLPRALLSWQPRELSQGRDGERGVG